jgi:aryl-alcohol dehydrogenase-like predicted oxidoreductase
MTSKVEQPHSSSKVPRRAFGTALSNERLPPTLPIVGLGCSSFSTFFWTDEDHQAFSGGLTVESITKDHPRVQEWIETIRYAVLECGITLLDTAPWYGHGTSEVVIGLALEQHAELRNRRADMTINTKVGRYEADPSKQFDFSHATTIQSIQRSLQRLQC